MQKQRLKQEQKLKLSPKQIQFLNLLQIPLSSLSKKIESELEENPALEEVEENEPSEQYWSRQSNNTYSEKTRPEIESQEVNLQEHLNKQLYLKNLSEEQQEICLFIVGCIDDAGFLSRSLYQISDDLLFELNKSISENELFTLLKIVQSLDPVGIGSRDLQECLEIQLKSKPSSELNLLCLTIVQNHFKLLTTKNFDLLKSKLDISDSELKSVYDEIAKLNPKPGSLFSNKNEIVNYITPDFLLTIQNNECYVSLNQISNKKLKTSEYYKKMLSEVKKENNQEAVNFLSRKIEHADWFSNALKQREETLLNTMNCIVEIQKEFFKSGDEKHLIPMKLLDVAQKIKMDISTISRVSNSKYIETPFGTFLLKDFFSEAYHKEDGTTISTKVIKNFLIEIITNEDKKSPLTDDQLAEKLDEKGFHIARRTVAKYRKQLKINSSKLRKEL
ncbi:MAG: RNA polymerase factor sigma-54 [Flavobacteriales bacterium]